MKKIKIIGILTILVVLLNLVFSMGDFVSGFKDGANHSINDFGFPCRLQVEEVSAATDSLFNVKVGKKIAYQTAEIETFAEPPVWVWLFAPFLLIAAIGFLLGFMCLIKLLITVSRKNVFTQSNVSYLRLFVYSQAIFLSLAWLNFEVSGYYAAQQIEMAGYKVIGWNEANFDWPMIMISILLTEIFAVGVKIKEEQDLTV